MKTVVLKIETLVTQHPPETSPGDWLFHVVNTETGEVVLEEASLESTIVREFDFGSYKASAVRMDLEKNPLGGTVSAAFTLTDDMIQVDTADALVVVIAGDGGPDPK